MIRWLILIPLGLCVAVAGAMLALLIAVIADSQLLHAIGDIYSRLFMLLLDMLSGGISDEDFVRLMLLLGATWQLCLALIIGPTLIMAIISEIFRIGSYLVQALLTALLTVIMPLALLPKTVASAGISPHILVALIIIGVCAGTLYWLIAGRGAGRKPMISDSARAG